jgi:hypothetical protein
MKQGQWELWQTCNPRFLTASLAETPPPNLAPLNSKLLPSEAARIVGYRRFNGECWAVETSRAPR